MVGAPNPNKMPWRATSPTPLKKSCKWKEHIPAQPGKQARPAPAHRYIIFTSGWGRRGNVLIRGEDKQSTTSITEWGRYKGRVAVEGYIPSSHNHGNRQDRLIEPVVQTSRLAQETSMAAKWRRAGNSATLTKLQRSVRKEDSTQSQGITGDPAGFRALGQLAEPLLQRLKSVTSYPILWSVRGMRSLVIQETNHTQHRDRVTAPRPPWPFEPPVRASGPKKESEPT